MKVQPCDSVTELASGIDAFYLSGRCVLPTALVDELEDARTLAGVSREVVPLRISGERFGVGWGPFGRYRFRLDHRHAQVGMTTSKGMPSLYVQPSAEFIHGQGIEAVVDWCRDVFGSDLGRIDWQVSRVDLFMDSQGWGICADDRRNFAARAKARRTYEQDDDLTGLQWGEGGAMMCRIYDKTRESSQKGTDWWPDVWGPRYVPGSRVVRVEYQVRRDALREFGLNTPEEVLQGRRALWEHLTHKWLSLRVPGEDSNRSRWAVAESWAAVQASTLGGSPIGEALVRQGATAGDLRRIVPALIGYMTKAGAHLNAVTQDDLIAALTGLLAKDERVRGITVEQRLAMQRRQLGLA